VARQTWCAGPTVAGGSGPTRARRHRSGAPPPAPRARAHHR
jgi:hypothetical protein